MLTWIAVAVGGALGSVARHGVNVLLTSRMAGPGPVPTAVVNLVGCAVIGVLAGLLANDPQRFSATARSFLFVGLLGGFTTFSSFGLDTLTLVQDGRTMRALVNVLVQVVVGIAAVFAGFAIASGK